MEVIQQQSVIHTAHTGSKNASSSVRGKTELISWDYEDDNGYVISIEQWGEQRFEASEGKCIQPFEINNILPKQKE